MNACRLILIGALALFAVGCSSSPQRQEKELLQLARQADQNYHAGKFDRARGQYETIIAANPNYVPAHLRLGAIAYHDGDMKMAQTRFETVNRLDPRNAQAQYNLAMLHLNEATALLGGYLDTSLNAANRQQVTALLGQLREFGGAGRAGD